MQVLSGHLSMFGFVGGGMLCMKRLKCVGERTEPWGTPFVLCCILEDSPLYTVYPCLPERKLASPFLKLRWMCVLSILSMSR